MANNSKQRSNLARFLDPEALADSARILTTEKHASHTGALDLATRRRMQKDGFLDPKHAKSRFANQELQRNLRIRHGQDIISVDNKNNELSRGKGDLMDTDKDKTTEAGTPFVPAEPIAPEQGSATAENLTTEQPVAAAAPEAVMPPIADTAIPVVPAAPTVPEEPVAPEAPVLPVAPEAPAMPTAPVVPTTPTAPIAPTTPDASVSDDLFAPDATTAPLAGQTMGLEDPAMMTAENPITPVTTTPETSAAPAAPQFETTPTAQDSTPDSTATGNQPDTTANAVEQADQAGSLVVDSNPTAAISEGDNAVVPPTQDGVEPIPTAPATVPTEILADQALADRNAKKPSFLQRLFGKREQNLTPLSADHVESIGAGVNSAHINGIEAQKAASQEETLKQAA